MKSTAPYQTVSRNPSDTRLKEVLNIMHTPKKADYSGTIPRDRSIENLSRDLDDRIAKIKQKYYETTNPSGSLYEPSRKLEGSDCRRWDTSHTEGRSSLLERGNHL